MTTRLIPCSVLTILLGFALPTLAIAQAKVRIAPPVNQPPVQILETPDTWTLDNGIVHFTVSKQNADVSSIVYRGVEILTPNRHHGAWEQRPTGTVTARVTIDPKTNHGDRAEIAVRGIHSADTAGPAGPALDIETRYTLVRGVSGFYTYSQYTHPATYPRVDLAESRFILENINPTFNWLSVDADRNQLMPIDVPEVHRIHAPEQSIYDSGVYKNSVEHKYDYNAPLYRLQAWGWSSTSDHIGLWFINPSNEYIVGGPERLDLIAHLSPPGSSEYRAILLDCWTSGHYGGGAENTIPAGMSWSHVAGPIFVYLNDLPGAPFPSPAELQSFHASFGSGMPAVPQTWHNNALTLWHDAVAMSTHVKTQWPYAWVEGMDYPHKEQRGTVTGQFVLDDPQAASTRLPNLNVGLTYRNYTGDPAPRTGNGNIVTWPHDGQHYQFWTLGGTDGRFTLTNVRPGTYTLRAFADGVLGEYDKTAEITVEPGKTLDLGQLTWKPVRYGRQLWEIGYPDRTADKFLKGDHSNYWLWGWGLRYAGLFPNDVDYTIGKSDFRKDWFFQQVPHSITTDWLNPAAPDPYNQRFGWVALPPDAKDPWPQWGKGRATTWTVRFTLPQPGKGRAVLRLALAGADSPNPIIPGTLAIGLNGQPVGTIHPISTNALRYNTNKGVWDQYIQAFDGALLKPGENQMTFTVPAGDVTTGVVWDYLRLELNDGTTAYPDPPNRERPDQPTLPDLD